MARLALLFVLLLAAPAQAGTVSVREASYCEAKEGCTGYSVAAFAAAPGEANDVTATVSGGEVTIADAGAPVTPGSSCRAVDAHTVACSGRHGIVPVLTLVLGDGDDRAVAPRDARIEGGDGDDRLTGGKLVGGDGNDVLDGVGYNEGGPGNDRLIGSGDAGPGDDVIDLTGPSLTVATLGPGSDVLIGGPGDDWIVDGEAEHPSRDRIDGGGGDDELDYRTSAVAIAGDLSQPSQFPAHDDVTGVERVGGSRFGDRLLGSEGADGLVGAGGDDVLEGRGGGDSLDGGEGADVLDGGPGDDSAFGGMGPDRILLGDGDDRVLATGDYHRDEVDCGAGRDTAGLHRGDRRAGCEVLTLDAAPRYVESIRRARGGRWRLHYGSCEAWPSCRGTTDVSARVRGRWIAVARVRFRGSSATFRPRRAVARELRRRGVLPVRTMTLPAPGEEGGVLPSESRLKLR